MDGGIRFTGEIAEEAGAVASTGPLPTAASPSRAGSFGARRKKRDRSSAAFVALTCCVIIAAGAFLYVRFHHDDAPAPKASASASVDKQAAPAAQATQSAPARRARRYSDSSPSAELNRRGLAMYRAGLYKEAADDFSAALSSDDGSGVSHVYYNNLAESHAAMGDDKTAEAFLFSSVTVEPEYPVAVNNLGVIYSGRGAAATAIELFERAVALAPDYPEAHYNLGAMLDSNGLPATAAVHYERSVQLKPDIADADRIKARVKALRSSASTKAVR